MRKLKLFLWGATMCALTFGAVSCGDKDDDEDEQPQKEQEEQPKEETPKDNDKEEEETPKVTTYTVTFDTDGGSAIEAQTVEKGKAATKPADPTKEGYTFVTWKAEGFAFEYDFADEVTEDITLKAYWDKIPVFPEGCIVGAFSVSATKKVAFAPGNLQYQASTKTWRFAPTQYEVMGVGNTLISDTYHGWIDLFGWGTGENPTLTSGEAANYATFSDWGKKIGDGTIWYTLGNKEWMYLLNSRKNASSKCGAASVNGINGLVLLPDEYTMPEGIEFKSGMSTDWGEDYFKTINEFTAEQWTLMETAGAVFLPAAGYRGETDVFRFASEGEYWTSSTKDDTQAYQVTIFSDSYGADGYYDISYGCAVRLACDL